jgi:hypothetical protein
LIAMAIFGYSAAQDFYAGIFVVIFSSPEIQAKAVAPTIEIVVRNILKILTGE